MEELHLVEETLEVGNLLEVHHLAEEILVEDLVDFFEEVVEILVGIPVMIIDQSMKYSKCQLISVPVVLGSLVVV